jgi:hypothetical protein
MKYYSFGHNNRMRWAGHVAHMGKRRVAYRVLVGKPEGKDHLGDPGLDGRIILNGPSRSGMWAQTGLGNKSNWK